MEHYPHVKQPREQSYITRRLLSVPQRISTVGTNRMDGPVLVITSWSARMDPSTDSGQSGRWGLMPKAAIQTVSESALRGLT